MDCQAKVMEKDGNRALVRVARINCAECGGCGLLARNREHTMEFAAIDRLGAREGDEVILKVPSHRLSLSYLVVFGLPILAMVAAYFAAMAIYGMVGGGNAQGVGIVAAVIVGFAAFWCGAKLANRVGLSPEIKEVIGPGDTDDHTTQGHVL